MGLLQTTGGKDEPNIVFMWKSQRTSQHGTQNGKTQNWTTQKKKKKRISFLKKTCLQTHRYYTNYVTNKPAWYGIFEM